MTDRRDTKLTRRQIEGLIAEGRKIVIVDNKVLKVDSWLQYHPGGEKAILHMVGRDATDEVSIMHSKEARQQMLRYQIGKIDGVWQNLLPPIQGGVFRASIRDESEIDDNVHEQASDGSRAPSPMFDQEVNARQRFPSNRSPSASSVSSLADETDGSGMGLLDARTKELLDQDLSRYPSLDPITQAEIVQKYRLLGDRIREAGLFNCNYWAYAIEGIRYTLFVSLSLLCLRWGWYGLSGLFLGMFWHQLTFVVHDAGHMGITHNFMIDTSIGIFIADFLGGMSLGWWKSTHNVHHIVTNHPEHDPDNQHMPIFAVSHEFLSGLYSTYHDRLMPFDGFAKAIVPYQAWLYYPILSVARFNLYFQSWKFLIQGQGPWKGPAAWTRWLEISGHLFFWLWFGYGLLYRCFPSNWDRFVFILVSHVTTSPLHVQITLSHFAMSSADLGPRESFPQKMLRTTMDVDCPQWLDFFHGGLQFQAIHHLFPRIPRHNLRAAQKFVQEFCVDAGIPYAMYGFVEGNKTVISNLAEIGRQAAILAECQRVVAAKGDILHGH